MFLNTVSKVEHFENAAVLIWSLHLHPDMNPSFSSITLSAITTFTLSFNTHANTLQTMLIRLIPL